MKNRKYSVGDIRSSKSYGDYEIIEILPEYNCRIKFIDTGYESVVQTGNACSGVVKDLYKPNCYGVGYQGAGKHYCKRDGKHSLSYKTWNDILKRCYSKTSSFYHVYGGAGVTVCDEWHNFQAFADWFEEHYVPGFKIDKDFTILGSKCYSPETCCFVPEHINVIIKKAVVTKHGLPIGVGCIDGKYTARMNTPEERRYLGYFATPELAFAAYKTAKEAYVKEIANHHYSLDNISETIYNNLLQYTVVPYPHQQEAA